jgi:hypothetical protein
MSSARDRFLGVGFMAKGEEAAENLRRAADLWRADGQHFSSGVAMLRASRAMWGYPDRMIEALKVAVHDFGHVAFGSRTDTPESLAALYKLAQGVWEFEAFDFNRAALRTRMRELHSELAQRLVVNFSGSEHAQNYLVVGINVWTDLDGTWTVQFPSYDAAVGTEQLGSEMILPVPSAFRLFVQDSDWQAAHEIILKQPDAFTTPGLRGWRAVTLANIYPEEAVARFDEASDAFAEDTEPDAEELLRRGGYWSSGNRDLWSKYYHARARVVESIQSPTRVSALLTDAANALVSTEFGWHNTEVSRFHVLIKVLTRLVSDPISFSADDARREYEREISMGGETDYDRFALSFIRDAASGFQGFATDPASEITRNRLGMALEALAKVPTIGQEVTKAISPEIGRSAWGAALGPVRSWMHRAFESITDEAVLRRVLLRLLQHGLPLYAQIRHGPIEYGKDIAVLLNEHGEVILRLYQVKCGDITKTKWRESKDELEEIFSVPLSTCQLPFPPQRVEAILITNGHANPYVEPVMQGWFREQAEHFKRHLQFMHLDLLVDWIVQSRLINELRVALVQEGIHPYPATSRTGHAK